MYDIQEFQHLQDYGLCKHTVPATCTALLISSLKWSLHGHHSYYFTIKATNLAGLSIRQTSVEYRHDVQLPSRGIVTDLPVSQSSSQRPKVCIDFLILVFNATFINISAISWRSVLVVEETRVPGENHRPWASNW